MNNLCWCTPSILANLKAMLRQPKSMETLQNFAKNIEGEHGQTWSWKKYERLKKKLKLKKSSKINLVKTKSEEANECIEIAKSSFKIDIWNIELSTHWLHHFHIWQLQWGNVEKTYIFGIQEITLKGFKLYLIFGFQFFGL